MVKMNNKNLLLLLLVQIQLYRVNSFSVVNSQLARPSISLASPTTVSCAISTPRSATQLEGTFSPSEKLTKEANELLQILEKKEGGNVSPLLVAQVAPSVRIAIPEEFGLEPGAYHTGQLVAALKQLGFDMVLDTNTGADITILEEATELLHRIRCCARSQTGDGTTTRFAQGDERPKPLPLFTSCCPGWMDAVAKSMPELLPYISSCKSPHMMYGALVKEYRRDLLDCDQVYLTSIMPCVKKRGESDHPAFLRADGARDVDNVVTTKDLGQLLRLKQIDPGKLEPVEFDSPFAKVEGTGTGAGQLFGATGGVMEAALRTAYAFYTGKELPRLEMEQVRGLDGVKETVVHMGDDLDLRVAVANGLGNAKTLIKQMKEGRVSYDFVEFMACPGGCIAGGGQPARGDVAKRLATIYKLDRSLPRRKSHENPTALKFYEDYLGDFGSETARKLLHVDPVYGEQREEK